MYVIEYCIVSMNESKIKLLVVQVWIGIVNYHSYYRLSSQ